MVLALNNSSRPRANDVLRSPGRDLCGIAGLRPSPPTSRSDHERRRACFKAGLVEGESMAAMASGTLTLARVHAYLR